VGLPINYPKPDLSALRSRQMMLVNRYSAEAELHGWVTEIVRKTKQPPPDNGQRAEMYLMDSAKPSIDVLMEAMSLQSNMNLATGRANGSKKTVHADFHWLRRDDGRWAVDQVCFALAADAVVNQLASQRALRQATLEKAELRNESHINLRKIAFPIEDMKTEDYSLNLRLGDSLIQYAIEVAHDNAKEDAKTLENPVTPEAMALDMLTVGIGAGTAGPMNKANRGIEKAAEELKGEEAEIYQLLSKSPVTTVANEAARKLASVERLEKIKNGAERGKMAKEAVDTLMDKEKSKGDKIFELGFNAAGFIPCPFINTIAGMMFDIAISSDAARVTKLRSRCYVFFVAGYINQLALTDTGVPPRKLDKKYFDLGAATAPKPGCIGTLRTQLSLMHYASDNYIQGGWAGLSFRKRNWHFPDQYAIYWNPILLGQALATQLNTRRYLIE
jgi:hypothetical protein